MTVVSNVDGKIWLALKSRLDVFGGCTVHYPMENYAPTSGDTFLIVQPVTTEYGGPLPIQAECGQPLTGFLNLSVLCPVDWTFAQLMGLAGQAADHFPNDARYSYADVVVKINGRSRVQGGVALNPPWNRVEVQVPWIAWG